MCCLNGVQLPKQLKKWVRNDAVGNYKEEHTLSRALIFSQFCETLTDNLGALATLAIKQQRNCLALISACSRFGKEAERNWEQKAAGNGYPVWQCYPGELWASLQTEWRTSSKILWSVMQIHEVHWEESVVLGSVAALWSVIPWSKVWSP